MDDCWRSFSKIALMIKDATSRPAVKECTSDGRPSLSSMSGRRFARPGGGKEGLRKQWGSTSCKTENLKVWSPSISADNSGWCWPVTGSFPHACCLPPRGPGPWLMSGGSNRNKHRSFLWGTYPLLTRKSTKTTAQQAKPALLWALCVCVHARACVCAICRVGSVWYAFVWCVYLCGVYMYVYGG